MLNSPPSMKDRTVTSTPDAKATSTFDVVEKVTKAAVAVLALSYGLGLVVSNQYLLKLGTSDFSSVRPKYVLTGFWVLLFLILSSMPALLPALSMTRKRQYIVLFACLGLGFSILCGYGFLIVLHFDFAWLNERMLVLGAMVGLILTNSIIVYALSVGVRLLADRYVSTKGLMASYLILALVFCAMLGNMTYQISAHIYNHIPEGLGGGKAVIATIILNEKGVIFWKQTEPLLPENMHYPEPLRIRSVKILYQDEKQLIIEVQAARSDLPKLNLTDKTLVFNRDLVDGVLIDSYPNRL